MHLSPIQNHIISRLKNADALRYSDMRPDETPNDLYNYHLKFLISKRLVEKSSTGYSLTENGRRHVADIHHTSDTTNRLFKMNVITIVSRNTGGTIEILNQVRQSQPSYGKIGVMGGTAIKGEPILDAAARKLHDETGLTASFRLLGHERRMMYRRNELFSDVLFPICYADAYDGTLTDTDFGQNFWTPIEQALENEADPHDSIASVTTVLQALQNNTIDTLPLFYIETTQQNDTL